MTKKIQFDGAITTITNAEAGDADRLRQLGCLVNDSGNVISANIWPPSRRQPVSPQDVRRALGLPALVLGAGEPKSKPRPKLTLKREPTLQDQVGDLHKLFAHADRQNRGNLVLAVLPITIIGKHGGM